MHVYYDPIQTRHYPRHFLVNGERQPNPEQPGRAEALLAAVQGVGFQAQTPPDLGLDPVAAVHSPEYIGFLANIWARWARIEGASPEVIPNIHPNRQETSYPDSAVGQAGYHMADTACPMNADSWPSIRASANTAAAAARAVLDGASVAYALCRPPGHHAFADMAGGFCYLNNSAIAAQVLRAAHDRVAIVDVDLHHGNGTQGIFYHRPDVLTVSVHADPVRYYPFFWGHAHERGAGAGLGYNLNLPLARGSADGDFLHALDKGLDRVRHFAPGALVVALGLDAFEGDPFGGLALSTPGFARVGAALAGLGLPTVFVQEGGYLCDELGANLVSALSGFLDTA